ncbi:MAG: 16S rRNA (guanine(966)-N(2))-methyltransferase RsmD [Actinomycetaceae bacterium]|nr:16S rRNA (guanine(966)-N(2))-methyltransferase RsmD [Actinomycetaceae bacterium]
MRIVAGSAKGKVLKVPSKGTRPTSERVREALFSMLEHRDFIDECAFLDLYAGTGACALEAVSRGARMALCVEKNEKAARLIRDNSRDVGLDIEVVCADAARWITANMDAYASAFDVVFIDPPYDVPNSDVTALLYVLPSVLVDDAMVIVERAKRTPGFDIPAGWECEKVRTWGDVSMYMLRLDVNNDVTENGK